jgi:hypothetical protein
VREVESGRRPKVKAAPLGHQADRFGVGEPATTSACADALTMLAAASFRHRAGGHPASVATVAASPAHRKPPRRAPPLNPPWIPRRQRASG